MNENSQIVVQGTRPGNNSATGFPVRSYHLSGLLEWTAVKGELLHHNQQPSKDLFRPDVKVRPAASAWIERRFCRLLILAIVLADALNSF